MEQTPTYHVTLTGGPLDGKTLPVSGDPMEPPDRLVAQLPPENDLQAIYSPRVNTDPDGGPWLYQYIRTEPVPRSNDASA
ncbi:hypothetical protein [Streptomyces nigrescens]|uniref:Uncharacterized protein n=1 Tax=Streptomyces nigrescens TaxID=1920 RepID=A0A640TCI0_STRNI|nr:hypothetical protein [Streptomyces libani]WAT94851.1 hypothetical protein STRLI_000522 [Streptomyces libani subsp. libani]GFE19996.1 hypothetical protein Sliba_04490 [Streptomyces libani subsp. libani]GGV85497.1 hypothetical protein GCM10010500_02020 [Streptomyces libani subsp. libani]